MYVPNLFKFSLFSRRELRCNEFSRKIELSRAFCGLVRTGTVSTIEDFSFLASISRESKSTFGSTDGKDIANRNRFHGDDEITIAGSSMLAK